MNADQHPSAREMAIGALAIVFSAADPTSEDDRKMIERNVRLLRLIIDRASDAVLDEALAQYRFERSDTQ